MPLKTIAESTGLSPEEIKALCWCGKKATMTARLIDGQMAREGEQVAIGGNELYTSLCRRHFMRGQPRAA